MNEKQIQSYSLMVFEKLFYVYYQLRQKNLPSQKFMCIITKYDFLIAPSMYIQFSILASQDFKISFKMVEDQLSKKRNIYFVMNKMYIMIFLHGFF